MTDMAIRRYEIHAINGDRRGWVDEVEGKYLVFQANPYMSGGYTALGSWKELRKVYPLGVFHLVPVVPKRGKARANVGQ